MITRRNVIRGLSAAAGAAAFGRSGSAEAALSGEKIGCKSYKILRVHVYAAVSHRETLWYEDPSQGWASWRQAPNMAAISPQALGAQPVPFTPAPDYNLSLGACADPLVGSDLLSRMRLVAMSHNQTQHVIGTALSLTGVRQGRPGFASLGARIQARYPGGALPGSWVLSSLSNGTLNGFATATGELGAINKPFLLPLGSNAVKSNLDRAAHSHLDSLSGYYQKRYNKRLTMPSGRVRAGVFDNYSNSLGQMTNWQQVHQLVNDGPSLSSVGGTSQWDVNAMTRGVEFGAYLLDQSSDIRHVDVFASANVDLHGTAYPAHATAQTGALWGVFNALRNVYDAGVLDLNNTLVVIQSEFGRANLDNVGTEHWGHYPVCCIGGPIKSQGLSGTLDFEPNEDGAAVGGYDPTSLQAALCLAGGVDPFQPGMFSLNDFPIPPDGGVSDPEENVRDKLALELIGAPFSDCLIPIWPLKLKL